MLSDDVSFVHKIIVALCSGKLCNMVLLNMTHEYDENLLPCLGGKEKERKDITFLMKGGSQNCTSVKIFLNTNFIVAVISQGKKFPLYCDISSHIRT